MALFKQNPTQENGDFESILDQELYTVPGTKTKITWADAIEGTLCLGSTGSGKTSGPAQYAGKAMLSKGWGFCILCAKPEEKDRWVRYAEQTSREKDLVIFNKDSNLNFNFLQYELDRTGDGAGEMLNMVNVLMNLNEQNRIHQSGGDGKEEKFWDNSLRRLISRSIMLLILAGEEVSIYNMRKLVSGCFKPMDFKLYNDIINLINNDEVDKKDKKQAVEDLDTWAKASFFLDIYQRVSVKDFESHSKEEEVRFVLDYWSKEFPNISERTMSIVIESFNGVIEPWFSPGILQEKFSGGLSDELWPENIIKKNSIVIIDFPVKEYGLAAIYAASIYKTAFQAAMERRDIKKEPSPKKPVALIIDEYQTFVSPLSDSLFQVTARSSWVACLYITQNINNIHFVMGATNPLPKAKSLLGNLNLKYFCSQSDYDTNKWASDMIGKHLANVDRVSINSKKEISKSKNQQLMDRFSPDEFTKLKTGRKANNFIVEAVVFKAGKTWGENGENYTVVKFNQKL